MADIIKLNSHNGIVSLDSKDVVEYDLLRWIRTSSKGIHNRCTIDDAPFEKVAAKLFVEKYPSDMIKVASKVIVKDKDNVDIYLRIAGQVSDQFYEKHPTKVIFSKSSVKQAD